MLHVCPLKQASVLPFHSLPEFLGIIYLLGDPFSGNEQVCFFFVSQSTRSEVRSGIRHTSRPASLRHLCPGLLTHVARAQHVTHLCHSVAGFSIFFGFPFGGSQGKPKGNGPLPFWVSLVEVTCRSFSNWTQLWLVCTGKAIRNPSVLGKPCFEKRPCSPS